MSTAPSTRTRRHRTGGWVPNQHGAWAMVVIPWSLGTWQRFRDGEGAAYALLLGLFWVVGYFAFHATSLWLKSRRQHRYLRPTVTYAAAAAVLGVATWWSAGPALIGWAVPFVPVLAVALLLAARRRERALIGGLLTVAAASLVVLVARFASPLEVVDGWGTPTVGRAVGLALICLGYFGGTVFFVKSMIRERGNAGFLALSVGWHVAATAVAVLATLLAHAAPWWAVFFGLTTVRSLALPLIGPMRPSGPAFTPRQLGLAEAMFSVALVGLALATA
ncbi:YwiC-like family protein [Raineyella sp. LH-20]|uniref:YwiC-like family protein n=1 Tax=Raineyella sp. LH-20 TaxID=3081204 RepID=UPI0029539CE8|nr:YwiC-like family protein [Raineyella sp. LH-20]WOP19944.1 YwiC-like family protein [Raineyella sp. LH-20]